MNHNTKTYCTILGLLCVSPYYATQCMENGNIPLGSRTQINNVLNKISLSTVKYITTITNKKKIYIYINLDLIDMNLSA